jgi:hypothetical protein
MEHIVRTGTRFGAEHDRVERATDRGVGIERITDEAAKQDIVVIGYIRIGVGDRGTPTERVVPSRSTLTPLVLSHAPRFVTGV